MFTLPDLPYDYAALEPYIDEKTMRIHHDKHHAAYVKNLNDALSGNTKLLARSVEELVGNLSQVPDAIRTKVRNNAGGHVNHTMFWETMAPANAGGGGHPIGTIAKAIDSSFDGFAAFQEKFTAAAVGRFGSGWAWLIVDSGKLAIVDTPNQDSPLMDGKSPLVGIDVWEHAYYLKYQNMRVDYIKAWWNVVNWKTVETRFAHVK